MFDFNLNEPTQFDFSGLSKISVLSEQFLAIQTEIEIKKIISNYKSEIASIENILSVDLLKYPDINFSFPKLNVTYPIIDIISKETSKNLLITTKFNQTNPKSSSYIYYKAEDTETITVYELDDEYIKKIKTYFKTIDEENRKLIKESCINYFNRIKKD